MDIDLFCDKLDRGEITDFSPFLYDDPATYAWALAERGLCIEQLITLDDEELDNEDLIVILIENGHGTQYYEEWKNHPDSDVREALAEQGYFPEHFIQDENRYVREAVFRKHPEFAEQGLVETKAEQDAAIEALSNMPNITLSQLENMLQYVSGRYNGDPYDIKQKSLEATPTMLFATMTPCALHKLGNPLWARGLSIKQISILEDIRVQYLREDEMDLFYQVFDQLAQAENREDAAWIMIPALKDYYEKNGNPKGVSLRRMFD